jgi:SAM-dependent methyltransferase
MQDRLIARLTPRFELIDATQSATHAELQGDIDGMQRLVGPVLNAIKSQNAQSRDAMRRYEYTQRNMADLTTMILERLQFVRNELLYEFQYGNRRPPAAAATGIEPKIVNEEKLAAAGTEVTLELGCGHLPREGRINVDLRELAGVDVVADAANLPFEPATVAEISSAHFLEHFPTEELRRHLLPYWVDLLRPGGRLVAVVPDSQTMVDEYAAGRLTFDELREVTFGGQEYAGDFHFTMFTPASLSDLLTEVGLVDVHVVETGRRNGTAYEMELEAFRPGATAS